MQRSSWRRMVPTQVARMQARSQAIEQLKTSAPRPSRPSKAVAGTRQFSRTSSAMGELVLENCRVPATALLGREGRGAEVFSCSMAWERACILATCVGTMRRQLERCIDYARTRKQFGQPIDKLQTVANRIAD